VDIIAYTIFFCNIPKIKKIFKTAVLVTVQILQNYFIKTEPKFAFFRQFCYNPIIRVLKGGFSGWAATIAKVFITN